MRAKAALAVLGLLAVVAVGCVRVVPGAEVAAGLVVFSAEAVSVVAKAGDDLSVIEAQEAAGLMAKVNLLGKVKGAYLRGSVSVGDLMFESQEAQAIVEGHLSRATVVYDPETKGPETTTIRAIATLVLSGAELAALHEYVR